MSAVTGRTDSLFGSTTRKAESAQAKAGVGPPTPKLGHRSYRSADPAQQFSLRGRADSGLGQELVLIAGATTEATLRDLKVENGCIPEALRTSGGAQLLGENLQVERDDALPCPLTADAIFADGFESGNTVAWSSTSPEGVLSDNPGAGANAPDHLLDRESWNKNRSDPVSPARRHGVCSRGDHPRPAEPVQQCTV